MLRGDQGPVLGRQFRQPFIDNPDQFDRFGEIGLCLAQESGRMETDASESIGAVLKTTHVCIDAHRLSLRSMRSAIPCRARIFQLSLADRHLPLGPLGHPQLSPFEQGQEQSVRFLDNPIRFLQG